jgi:hypothetical protein
MTKNINWPDTVPERAKLVRYYIIEEGWTYLQLAVAFGVTRSTIAGVCYRASIRMSDRAKKSSAAGTLPSEYLSTKLTSSPTEEAPVDIMAKRSGFTPKLKKLARPVREHPVPDAVPIKGSVWSPLPGVDPVAFADTTASQCKWMVGHHLCCGAQVVVAKPYCPTHCAVAYRETPPIKRRPDRAKAADLSANAIWLGAA